MKSLTYQFYRTAPGWEKILAEFKRWHSVVFEMSLWKFIGPCLAKAASRRSWNAFLVTRKEQASCILRNSPTITARFTVYTSCTSVTGWSSHKHICRLLAGQAQLSQIFTEFTDPPKTTCALSHSRPRPSCEIVARPPIVASTSKATEVTSVKFAIVAIERLIHIFWLFSPNQ